MNARLSTRLIACAMAQIVGTATGTRLAAQADARGMAPLGSPRFLVPTLDAASPTTPVDPARLPMMQRRIALALDGATRPDALTAIARASGLQLAFESQLVSGGTVTIRGDSIPIATALATALLGTETDVLVPSLGAIVVVYRTSPSPAPPRPQTVRGRVTTAQGAPVASADVIATMAPDRQIHRTATDSSGSYALVMTESSGDFLLYIGAAGFAPFRRRITGPVTDTALVMNATLAAAAGVAIAPVVAAAPRVRPSRVDDGDRAWTSVDFTGSPYIGLTGTLSPTEAGDLIAMGATIPGLLLTPDGGLSAFGLDPSQNRVTLNGLSTDFTSLPRGLPIYARFVTNSFDPTVGGFAGVGMNVGIRGGSLLPYRGASMTLDAPQLQTGDATARGVRQRFTDVSAAFNQSNELVPDLWAYNAGAQVQHRRAPSPSLIGRSEEFLRRAGVARDSVERFLGLLGGAGIPLTHGGDGDSRTSTTFTGAFRADRARAVEYCCGLLADQRARVGIVGLGTITHSAQDGASEASLPSHAGSRTSGSGSLTGNYSRYLGGGYTLTETNSSVAVSFSRANPYLELPEARVRVTSTLSDGSSAIRTLTGGGSTALASSSLRGTWAFLSELKTSPASHRLHQLKASLASELTGYRSSSVANGRGSFTFNSLAEFAANAPASYTRTLSMPDRAGVAWTGSLALADYFAKTPNLAFTLGPRIEANVFANGPAYNAAALAALGIRTDRVPNRIHVSPRLGFRWQYLDSRHGGGAGGISISGLGTVVAPPKGVLSGGIGEFRSSMPATLVSDALVGSGMPGTSVERLTCLGAAAPAPQWAAYAADPSTIPSACAGGGAAVFRDTAPDLRLFGPGYDAPRSWRANLNWASGRTRLFYSIAATYSLNLNQTGSVDANFAGTRQFGLADEAGRPVFVPVSSIVTTTGLVSPVAARRSAQFGRAAMSVADLRSETKTFSVNVSPYISRRIGYWTVAETYTFTDSRAQARGFDGSSGGDPRDREWAPGVTPRHALRTQGGYSWAYKRRGTLAGSLGLTAGLTLASGFRYTPLVAGDINGDGLSNDRAFVFDPATAPSNTVRDAMRALLDDAPATARDCLRRQLGAIAARNSCRQPFTVAMNMRADWRYQMGTYGRGFHMSLNFANPLSGIDQLLHGSAGMRGWGVRNLPDPTLLYVRGFDPSANRFVYEVNPRFGDSRPRSTGIQNPFRVTLFVDFDINTATADVRSDRYIRPTRSAPGVRPSADTIYKRLMSTGSSPVQFTAAIVRAFSDSLLLSREQVSQIQAFSDARRARQDSVMRALADSLASLPMGVDIKRATAIYQTATANRNTNTDEFEFLARVLTPIQIRLLPADYIQRLPASARPK